MKRAFVKVAKALFEKIKKFLFYLSFIIDKTYLIIYNKKAF